MILSAIVSITSPCSQGKFYNAAPARNSFSKNCFMYGLISFLPSRAVYQESSGILVYVRDKCEVSFPFFGIRMLLKSFCCYSTHRTQHIRFFVVLYHTYPFSVRYSLIWLAKLRKRLSTVSGNILNFSSISSPVMPFSLQWVSIPHIVLCRQKFVFIIIRLILKFYLSILAPKKRLEDNFLRTALNIIKGISSEHPPCRVSPKADSDRYVQNVRKLQSACKSGGVNRAF